MRLPIVADWYIRLLDMDVAVSVASKCRVVHFIHESC